MDDSIFEKDIRIDTGEENDDEVVSLNLLDRIIYSLTNRLLRILDCFDSEEPYYDFGVKPNEKKKIRLFFLAGFLDRSKYYLPLYLTILALFLGFNFPTQVYGLILDWFGAIIIAFGLFRGINGIERETETHVLGGIYGGRTWHNNSSLSAAVRETVDGVWGAFFLVSGFTVQILGAVNVI